MMLKTSLCNDPRPIGAFPVPQWYPPKKLIECLRETFFVSVRNLCDAIFATKCGHVPKRMRNSH